MNLAKEVRRTVLQGRAKDIQRLLLSDESLELYRSINLGDISKTSQLAKAMGISSQNANAKLSRLYHAGYVQRREQTADSGGREYFYFTS